jgi:hypothetical protein
MVRPCFSFSSGPRSRGLALSGGGRPCRSWGKSLPCAWARDGSARCAILGLARQSGELSLCDVLQRVLAATHRQIQIERTRRLCSDKAGHPGAHRRVRAQASLPRTCEPGSGPGLAASSLRNRSAALCPPFGSALDIETACPRSNHRSLSRTVTSLRVSRTPSAPSGELPTRSSARRAGPHASGGWRFAWIRV